MAILSADSIKTLSAPFPENVIGVKVQSVSKNKDRAMLVLYVQHTDVYARLEEVDPAWSCKVTWQERRDGQNWSTATVRLEMTVLGVTRENIGEGNDEKGAVSDAIKRTAMLFGVGRYLYDSETPWVPYNEQNNRYRQYTYAEYKAACRPKASSSRPAQAQAGGRPQATPAPGSTAPKPGIAHPSGSSPQGLRPAFGPQPVANASKAAAEEDVPLDFEQFR